MYATAIQYQQDDTMETNFAMKYLTQIILAIGAIIGIISFFTAWYSYSGLDVTGMKLISYANNYGWQMYIPLITVILSVVSLFIGALPHCEVKIEPKMLNAIIIAIGIIMLAFFAVLFLKDLGSGDKFGNYAGIGMWLGLIAGIVPIVVGALGYFGVFNKCAEMPTETAAKAEEPAVETAKTVDQPAETPAAPEEPKDSPEKPQ